MFKTKNARRNTLGSGMIELSVGLAVCVPIVLICIDLGTIAFGAYLNDVVCREAARAAAAGPPAQKGAGTKTVATAETPYQRAVSVIKYHVPTNMPIKVLEQPQVNETVRDFPPPELGGAVDGDVTVETTVDIAPPFLVRQIINGSVKAKAKHVVSYTYVLTPSI